jgi:hypothetical protein
MLELRLRCGQVVSFDGRVVEVFGAGGPSTRFHIEQLEAPEPVEAPDGGLVLALENGSATLLFAREEAPACARLVAALAAAHSALDHPGMS